MAMEVPLVTLAGMWQQGMVSSVGPRRCLHGGDGRVVTGEGVRAF